MKFFTRFLAIMAIATLFALPAVSQTAVQQAPTRLDSCSTVNATAAVNNTATVTLTPPNSQSVYLCGLDIAISNDATGAVTQANVSFTTTNLGGWAWKYSSANAANTSLTQAFYWNVPVKSAQPGVAVTIVSPAVNAHAAYSINAYYYFAP